MNSTWHSTMSKSLIKPMKNEVSQKAKTRCGNAYKTCQKWRLFESKSQNGLENDQKSITFTDKFHMTFRHVEKPYKTNEKRGSQKSKTRCKNPYKTYRKRRLFSRKRKKGFQNDQKSITFIDETHTSFRYVKKPYKTNEKQGFSKAKNALRKPL